jgi:hypothetical protein
MPWWGWALVGWTGLSFVLSPLVGLALREADRRERRSSGLGTATAPPTPAPRRRRMPVPPLAIALMLGGAVLQTVGFLIRVTGNERGAARLWAMDLPLAVPRMYVAALFLLAALAALTGAVRLPGRRPWWGAVALISAGIAGVKAEGTVHVEAVAALGLRSRPVVAVVLGAVVVSVVLALLRYLSRDERRDRRRMLTALGLYGVAAVGLSGVSSVVGQAGAGLYWRSAATFVEETGEALGAVAVLVAVLVGVAPRLVLPADWPLRRRADAQTIDAPGALPHRTAG